MLWRIGVLIYGKGSQQRTQRSLDEICRHLHCTSTSPSHQTDPLVSHPALEGTLCGHDKVIPFISFSTSTKAFFFHDRTVNLKNGFTFLAPISGFSGADVDTVHRAFNSATMKAQQQPSTILHRTNPGWLSVRVLPDAFTAVITRWMEAALL